MTSWLIPPPTDSNSTLEPCNQDNIGNTIAIHIHRYSHTGIATPTPNAPTPSETSGTLDDLGLENKPAFKHLDLQGCKNIKGRAPGLVALALLLNSEPKPNLNPDPTQ